MTVVPPYIKKWRLAKKAILLRNSNKVIQVIFQDKSELVLASGAGMVTFVNAKQQIKVFPLLQDSNLEIEDPSLFKRLQYAKEVLVQMIGNNTTGSGDSNEVQMAYVQKTEPDLDEPQFISNKMTSSSSQDGLHNKVVRNLN